MGGGRGWLAAVLASVLFGVFLSLTATAFGQGGSPTGPIGPVFGQSLDPLAPGEIDDPPPIQQPTAAAPYYYQSFGSGFTDNRWAGNNGAAVAVGGGRIYVASQLQGTVSMYDADTLAYLGSFGTVTKYASAEHGEGPGIAYYRGEVYLADDSASRPNGPGIDVFDANGTFRRHIPTNLRTGVNNINVWVADIKGIDVAWGEIWLVSTKASSDLGQHDLIQVRDARTGGLKALIPLTSRTHCEPYWPQQGWPLFYPDWDQYCFTPVPSTASSSSEWWDIALSPELGQAVVDYRGIDRTSPLVPSTGLTERHPLYDVPYLEDCSYAAGQKCDNWQDPQGVYAVPGMKWLLAVGGKTQWDIGVADLWSPYRNPVNRGEITEYALNETGVDDTVPGSAALVPGQLSLTLRRQWLPYQATVWSSRSTIRDVAYRNRDTRIDWWGDLTDAEWQRQTRCLSYIVSDADIYVIGAYGERWLEPARGFQSITLYLDGVARETKYMSSGGPGTPGGGSGFCLNLDNESSGVHKLTLQATVDGGRTVTVENDQLHVDRDAPAVNMAALGPYVSGQVAVAGAATDSHSGLLDWEVQVTPAGPSNWQTVCPRTSLSPTGEFSCQWNTSNYADGSYTVRTLVRDKVNPARGGPNVGSQEATVFVDNTDPTVSATGELRDRQAPELILESDRPNLSMAGQDSASGVKSIEFTVDGVRYYYDEQGCPAGGCSMSRSYTFNPLDHTLGQHTARVVVADQAGHTAEQSWKVLVNRQGPQSSDPTESPSRGEPEQQEDFTDPNENPGSDGFAGSPGSTQAAAAMGPAGLTCASGDLDVVHVIVDYARLPVNDLPDIGPLPSPGSSSPLRAVTGLLAVGGLPLPAATAFSEEFDDPPFVVFSAYQGGDRRAVMLLEDTGEGLIGHAVSGCSQFFASYDPLGGGS